MIHFENYSLFQELAYMYVQVLLICFGVIYFLKFTGVGFIIPWTYMYIVILKSRGILACTRLYYRKSYTYRLYYD